MFLMILICSLIIQQNDLQKKMRYVYDSPNRRIYPFSVIFLYMQFGIITILVNWEEVKIIYMYNGSIIIGLSDGLLCSGASESIL